MSNGLAYQASFVRDKQKSFVTLTTGTLASLASLAHRKNTLMHWERFIHNSHMSIK